MSLPAGWWNNGFIDTLSIKTEDGIFGQQGLTPVIARTLKIISISTKFL
jgi:hypothetical protein